MTAALRGITEDPFQKPGMDRAAGYAYPSLSLFKSDGPLATLPSYSYPDVRDGPAQYGPPYRLRIEVPSWVNSIGITCKSLPPENVFLANVHPKLWAAEHDVRRNDELVSINGTPAKDLRAEDLFRQLRQRPLLLTFLTPPSCLNGQPRPSHLGWRPVNTSGKKALKRAGGGDAKENDAVDDLLVAMDQDITDAQKLQDLKDALQNALFTAPADDIVVMCAGRMVEIEELRAATELHTKSLFSKGVAEMEKIAARAPSRRR